MCNKEVPAAGVEESLCSLPRPSAPGMAYTHPSEWNSVIFFFRTYLFYFLCLSVLPTCMYTICMPDIQRPEGGIEFPGTVLIDSCVPLCRCWKPNLGPLQKQ